MIEEGMERERESSGFMSFQLNVPQDVMMCPRNR